MRYSIRKKMLSLKDDFLIEDQQGKVEYLVRSSMNPFLKKIFITDSKQNEKVIIKKRLLRILPSYKVFLGDDLKMVVKTKIKKLRLKPFVIGIDNEYSIDGNAYMREYTIFKDDKKIARISSDYSNFMGSYGVDIVDHDSRFEVFAIIVMFHIIYKKRIF